MDNTIDWFSNFVETMERYPTREELNDLNIVPSIDLIEYALIYNFNNVIDFTIKEYPEIIDDLPFRSYILGLSLGRITNLVSIITQNKTHFNTLLFQQNDNIRNSYLYQFKKSLLILPEGIAFPDDSHEIILKRQESMKIPLNSHNEWLLLLIYNLNKRDPYIVNVFPKLPSKYKTIFKALFIIDNISSTDMIKNYIPDKKYIDIYYLILSYNPSKVENYGMNVSESFRNYLDGKLLKDNKDVSLFLLNGEFIPDSSNYRKYGMIISYLMGRIGIEKTIYLSDLFINSDLLKVINNSGMIKKPGINGIKMIYDLLIQRVSIEEIFLHCPSICNELIRLSDQHTLKDVDPIKYINLMEDLWTNNSQKHSHYSLYSFNQLFLYKNIFVGLMGDKYNNELLTDIFNNVYDDDRIRI